MDTSLPIIEPQSVLSRFSRVPLFATPWTTKLLGQWDSPGKNAGVCRHSLLQDSVVVSVKHPSNSVMMKLANYGQICW